MPNQKFEKLDSLNELNAVSVLLFLLENNEPYATDMKVVISSYDRLKKLMERMDSEGLVDINIEEYPRIRITYKLTSKGKEVAQKLLEIEKIMEKNDTGY
jgi:DNA-binding PadR family transcriptional regulator